MLIAKTYYTDQDAREILVETFHAVFTPMDKLPLFLCIGSDRHILDCFGPLVGTMLSNDIPELDLYGTLDKPLHAKNIIREIREIRKQCPDRIEVGIDASIGTASGIGLIKFKQGSLLPGKALFKNLPPIGHYSLIGIVGNKTERRHILTNNNSGSLTHVYHMAELICSAVYEWYTERVKL